MAKAWIGRCALASGSGNAMKVEWYSESQLECLRHKSDAAPQLSGSPRTYLGMRVMSQKRHMVAARGMGFAPSFLTHDSLAVMRNMIP